MPIGDSKGAFHETEFHELASPWSIDPKMEITPNKVETDKQLDKSELHPSTGMGIEVKSDEIDWSKMNQELGTLKGTAPEDTPVVAKAAGGIKITEGDINQAIDVGLGAGPGIIAGAASRTAKAATNWFTGADGHLRYEIGDSGSKYNPPKMSESGPLSRFLDHPELFEAYPELKKVKVMNDPYYSNKGAVYDIELNTIRMGSAAAEDKGILLHELQHAVQGLEGFAKGGTPGKDSRSYKLLYEDDINKLRPEFLNLQGKATKGDLESGDKSRLEQLKTIFKKYSEYARAGEEKSREHYLSLAGEVEARNVQTRASLTPEERLKYSPESTEDTVRSKQIVRDKPSLTTPYQDPVSGFMTY